MICPCKDCDIRYIGCHDKCTDYINWKSDKDRLNETIHNEKLIKSVINDLEGIRCKSRSYGDSLNRYRDSKRKSY